MKFYIIIAIAVLVGIISLVTIMPQDQNTLENSESYILENKENLDSALLQCDLIMTDASTFSESELLVAGTNWEYCINNAIDLYGTIEQKEIWEAKKQQNPLRFQIDQIMKNTKIQECNEQWSNQTQIDECIENVNLQFP
ncbi:hypothetical protein [Nitrosopumilus adriaticus]|uniref:Uncharacterized protein n=1 Tax=Nitrosopumilus adriaticus TaxID=1580092 RepID=A0A0D5C5D3_9ARCH|nr:hypothetical protein [Nitrosopumilus adriaticus]AJW71570.1 hypothetical protein NADRNF5_1892 [Nitrosopumilus adriaticus]